MQEKNEQLKNLRRYLDQGIDEVVTGVFKNIDWRFDDEGFNIKTLEIVDRPYQETSDDCTGNLFKKKI